MIGWIVEKMSSEGNPPIGDQVAAPRGDRVPEWAEPAVGVPESGRRDGCGVEAHRRPPEVVTASVRLVGRRVLAREGEEDVVEARFPDRQRLGLEIVVVERAYRLEEDAGAVGGADAQHGPFPVRLEAGRLRDEALRPERFVVARKADLDDRVPELRLQGRGGVRGDDVPFAHHGDPIGEAVCFFEVLGGEQHGRPVGHELADHLPQLVATVEVESGRRLVEEHDGGTLHERRGHVETAPHAPRVGPGRTVRGV